MSWDRLDWQAAGHEIGNIIRECLETANMTHIRIRWEWNGRFTRRMGDAKADVVFQTQLTDCRSGRVRFSRPLWPRASEAERRETVIHEVAHVLANIAHGTNCGHGPRWKRMMIVLGGTTKWTHSVDRTGLTRLYVASCPCCGKEIKFGPRIRSNWIRRQQTRICRHCRGKLAPAVAQSARLAS